MPTIFNNFQTQDMLAVQGSKQKNFTKRFVENLKRNLDRLA